MQFWLRPPPEDHPLCTEREPSGKEKSEKDKDHTKQPSSLVHAVASNTLANDFVPKWAFFKFSPTASVDFVYHIEIHWLTADSHVIDDFVNQLFRRAAQWGLRMVQVPEFFCTENLQVHPYRAQPYLGIPPCPNVPTGQVQIESRVNSTAKHLLPTQDTNAQYNVRSTAMATTDSTTSYSMASPSSGEHTSLALMKSGVSSTYSNQKEQNTFVSTRAPHPSTLAYSLEKQRMHFQKYRNHENNQFSNQGDSQPSQYRTSTVEGMEQQTGVIHGTIDEYGLMVYPYPAPIMLVEKLFLDFRGRVWIEDEKRATNWDLLGLPRPQYKTMRPYDWERRSMPLSSASSTSANTKLDNSHARYNHVSTKKSDSMGAQNEMSSESGSRGAEAPSIERSPVATTTINTPSTYSEQSRLGPARSTAAAVGGMLTGTIRSLLGVGGNVQEQEQSLSS